MGHRIIEIEKVGGEKYWEVELQQEDLSFKPITEYVVGVFGFGGHYAPKKFFKLKAALGAARDFENEKIKSRKIINGL